MFVGRVGPAMLSRRPVESVFAMLACWECVCEGQRRCLLSCLREGATHVLGLALQVGSRSISWLTAKPSAGR